MFIATLFTIVDNSWDMETIQMSHNWWMDTEDVVHKYSGIPLNHKNELNNAIFSNMDTIRDDHTKWSCPKKRQIPWDITYMWNLKDNAHEPIYETESGS